MERVGRTPSSTRGASQGRLIHRQVATAAGPSIMSMAVTAPLEPQPPRCGVVASGGSDRLDGDSLEEAFCFQIVTFSRLGMDDLALGPDWRVLSSLQAAAGTILFEWITALVATFVHAIVAAPGKTDT